MTLFDHQETAARMKEDFEMILQFEQASADAGKSLQVLTDLKTVLTPTIRLLFLLYEADGFKPDSRPGMHILVGLLRTLPDSKLVEDLHGVVRVQRNTQKNKKQSVHQIQQLVTQANVLTERGIRHPAAVDRDCFLQSFKRTKDHKRKRRYFARTKSLPQRWSMIMERKTWGSLTEDILLRGVAAFAFLRAYKSQNMKRRGIRVAHGLFSKFASDLIFLSYTDPLEELPRVCGLCLGHCNWGILLWPIKPYYPTSDEWWSFDASAGATWAHIVEPCHWSVWHFRHESHGNDMILMRFEKSGSLLQHFFGNIRNHNLVSKDDLSNLAEHLGVLGKGAEVLKKMPQLDLIDHILDAICDGDVGWTEPIKKAMRGPKEEAPDMEDDPSKSELGTVLDEIIMSELPQDERKDFKQVHDAITNKITSSSGWTMVAGRKSAQNAKAKAKSKARAKAKAKPAAKAKGRGRGRGRGRGAAARRTQHLVGRGSKRRRSTDSCRCKIVDFANKCQ